MSKVIIGVIADDFTGASDAASFIAGHGVQTVLVNGYKDCVIPETDVDCAVVIATKTRSLKTDEAIAEAAAALNILRKCGAERIYIKYCSTFDSTPAGNIGPVMDYMLETCGAHYSLLAPALPVNGRTVKDGILFVNGTPLAESPMKDHPLNPMWESEISKLMSPQSIWPCFTITGEEMSDSSSLVQKIDYLKSEYKHFYLVPDYTDESQGLQIANHFKDECLLSGGSGLVGHLAEAITGIETSDTNDFCNPCPGKTILLSGSCSVATREQVRTYKDTGAKCLEIDPDKVLSGETSAESIFSCVQEYDDVVLVHTAELTKNDAPESRNLKAAALEDFMGKMGLLAFENGYKHIICAGGETSGAVTKAIGCKSYWIGPSVAPGVPVMTPSEYTDMRLVLKSGNFGQKDFFEKAIELTCSK